MSLFTFAALLPLHSKHPGLIGPSPQSRPISANPRSETDTVLRPTPRMDLLAALLSNTPE